MRLHHVLALSLLATPAYAAEPANYPCPNNTPCHVITLDDQEMKILAGPNGILQTAAQARQLDLAQFVIYFQNKLQQAPLGHVEAPPAPKPATPDASGNPAPEKPVVPLDNK